ncbi:MAG: gas vesicle protein GvpN, partial [Actinobacteria bacterium]|nr:gas vesicle protein GvpN [Actinomycetota bacterium]
VHKAQDALKDRMITVRLGYYDRDTEIAITAQKSGLSGEDAARVVDIIGGIRDDSLPWTDPSLRASIMISKVLVAYDKRPAPGDDVFVQSCMDVLCAKENGDVGVGEEEKLRSELEKLIGKYC